MAPYSLIQNFARVPKTALRPVHINAYLSTKIPAKRKNVSYATPGWKRGCHPSAFRTALAKPASPVFQLVKKFKVALPLHPEFGTKPQIFYIPPVYGPNAIDSQGDSSGPREDAAYLKKQYGPGIKQIKATMEKERGKQKSELMDVLCAYPTWKI